MIATPAMAAKASGFHIGGDVGQSNWNVTERDANKIRTRFMEAMLGGRSRA